MEELWIRLESLLQSHAPEVFASLNPPATVEEIRQTEQVLGFSFPDDVRVAYLRHNGAADQTIERGPRFFYLGGWCCLERMVGNWRSKCEVADNLKKDPDGMESFPEEDESWSEYEVRPQWWNPHRIPVCLTNTVSALYVDMQPGPAGVRGQLLKDAGMNEAIVIARSLNEYLTTMADRLEQGLMAWDVDKEWMNAATKTSIIEWKSMWG
ncbi:SMI1/KNR4 family protein [Aquabacterium sp. A7-Y]|uniref:SMI1/KNR4 family protein n=1 Tax=Aquabacterium sp. A7-Y TaxID=1349605 RepID=UPI00223D6AE3|nr:SMI1/KNR4 family protein [Aquabacterium sp. A7-Y]MCW7540953.1 SMI1/KNR4 family protein [Aquabacterium sp. A7-Y]